MGEGMDEKTDGERAGILLTAVVVLALLVAYLLAAPAAAEHRPRPSRRSNQAAGQPGS